MRETPFGETDFLAVVGGAGDLNSSAWGRVLVFSQEKKLFNVIFLSPAFKGGFFSDTSPDN